MQYSIELMRSKLDLLDPELREILMTILEEIEQHREASVTKNEFVELKELVKMQNRAYMEQLIQGQEQTRQTVRELAETMKELAEAQRRTEQTQERTGQRVEGLAETLKELAEAQRRTEQRVEELVETMKELAEAQQRTEQAQERTGQRVEELAETMKELAEAQKQTELAQKQSAQELAQLLRLEQRTRSQLGGLSRSTAYALENEAFRKLPGYLKTHFQLDVTEKFVRTFIGGEEINVFAKAKQNGEEVLLVGEAVLRLDDNSKMKQLEKNVNAVKQEFGLTVVPLVITHFAHPDILRKARERGVMVVQSFEWD